MQFPQKQIKGALIVARECLIEGDFSGESLDDFWKTRAAFMQRQYKVDLPSYKKKTIAEFQKIIAIPKPSIVYLWFEDDLFCMCNFWFSLSLLPIETTIYLVKPKADDWNGFGSMSQEELHQAYQNKNLLEAEERALMLQCWKAYKTHNLKHLQSLSKNNSPHFPKLAAVCQAHVDRFPNPGELSRPALILQSILSVQSNKEFKNIFPIFNQQAGIYGFGDVQVKQIYDQVIQAFN